MHRSRVGTAGPWNLYSIFSSAVCTVCAVSGIRHPSLNTTSRVPYCTFTWYLTFVQQQINRHYSGRWEAMRDYTPTDALTFQMWHKQEKIHSKEKQGVKQQRRKMMWCPQKLAGHSNTLTGHKVRTVVYRRLWKSVYNHSYPTIKSVLCEITGSRKPCGDCSAGVFVIQRASYCSFPQHEKPWGGGQRVTWRGWETGGRMGNTST